MTPKMIGVWDCYRCEWLVTKSSEVLAAKCHRCYVYLLCEDGKLRSFIYIFGWHKCADEHSSNL